MTTLKATGAALVAASLTVSAASALTPDEIAALPQDQVETAKRYCSEMYPDSRLSCEDRQFEAIKILIARGSIPPSGDPKQNAEKENQAAMAVVMFSTAQGVCNLNNATLEKFKNAVDGTIEASGLTWETLRSGQKPIIGNFLKQNPNYERITNGDTEATSSFCDKVPELISKLKKIPQ